MDVATVTAAAGDFLVSNSMLKLDLFGVIVVFLIQSFQIKQTKVFIVCSSLNMFFTELTFSRFEHFTLR